MRNGTWEQRTVLQARVAGGKLVPVAELPAVSLVLDSATRLTIDGEDWHVFGQRSVAIDTATRTVVTTIMVVRDS